MAEPRTSEDRKKHLYLLFDDWKSGYSIRKVSLSRRSGKRSSSSDSSGEEDSEQLGSGKGAKSLPVFMRVSAERGYPEFFTSAFGTKIMVMHPRPALHDILGVPVIDVVDQTYAFEALLNPVCVPIYIPVSDDRLFVLDVGIFKVLKKLERSGDLWSWENVTRPAFKVFDVSSYAVTPDGCILFSTKSGFTYIFDTKESVWKEYCHWVFPFTGRGHYDPSLKGFFGLSKDPDTLGHLYCCTMASSVTGNTRKVLHSKPDLKCTMHTVHNKNPSLGQHVSATLVHMRPGKFCLVECVSIDDKGSTDQELRVLPGAAALDFVRRPQGGHFMYCLKTFSLSIIRGDLKLKDCKVRCYSLPHEARIGTIRKDPVAFWL